MFYYIYKITNLKNNLVYIGLTNNVKRRRYRHFYDLSHNKHDNSFLQNHYNIYGSENFVFEIIHEEECDEKRISELERYYIKKYDSYLNGYNQNEGGNFGPSNGGTHLTKNDIFDICSALEFCSRPGAVLSEIFNVTTTTISRIKKKKCHIKTIEEYQSKSLEERKTIYDLFCKNADFYEKKIHKTVLQNKRKISRQQVYMILCNEENDRIIPLKRWLLILPNIKSENTIRSIINGKYYKDYYSDYQKISTEEKQNIVASLWKLVK